MLPLRFFHGIIHSPFLIFVRCAGRYTDADFLEALGIKGYRSRALNQESRSCLYLTEDAEWMHLADDWLYSLWNNPGMLDALAEMGMVHELFWYVMGDADESYNYSYYRDGDLVRHVRAVDPHYKGAVVIEEFGARLPPEEADFPSTVGSEQVAAFAQWVGIGLPQEELSMRAYQPPRDLKAWWRGWW